MADDFSSVLLLPFSSLASQRTVYGCRYHIGLKCTHVLRTWGHPVADSMEINMAGRWCGWVGVCEKVKARALMQV